MSISSDDSCGSVSEADGSIESMKLKTCPIRGKSSTTSLIVRNASIWTLGSLKLIPTCNRRSVPLLYTQDSS
ncbi:hypothetical protein KIPB_013679, partial [Kipferlia bialata]|eukprot:g13679.t1